MNIAYVFVRTIIMNVETCYDVVVSGTEKQAVANDYVKRLAWGNAAAEVNILHQITRKYLNEKCYDCII